MKPVQRGDTEQTEILQRAEKRRNSGENLLLVFSAKLLPALRLRAEQAVTQWAAL
jgi:hypothetical protein